MNRDRQHPQLRHCRTRVKHRGTDVRLECGVNNVTCKAREAHAVANSGHPKSQKFSRWSSCACSQLSTHLINMPKARTSLGKGKKAKPTAEEPKLYSSFLPIPLALPVASSSKATATHYIYVRPHATKSADEDERSRADRTLFVANIPVDAGLHDLRTLFGRWGVVEEVAEDQGRGGDVLEAAVRGLPDESDSEDDEETQEPEETPAEGAEPNFLGTGEKLPRSRRQRRPNTLPPSVPELVPLPPLNPRTPYGPSGARVARVVFVDSVCVSRVMSYTGSPIDLVPSEPSGLSYYEAQYDALRPPLAVVKAHADSALARHDHLHSLLLSSRAKAHGAGALVDEDGFTVVVRGGRYGRTAGRGGDPGGAGVAVASRAGVKEALGKKRGAGSGELKDFYRFQMVDRKRKGESAVLTFADLRTRPVAIQV